MNRLKAVLRKYSITIIMLVVLSLIIIALGLYALTAVTPANPTNSTPAEGLYLPNWDCSTLPNISSPIGGLYVTYRKTDGKFHLIFFSNRDVYPGADFWSDACPLPK